MMSAGPLKKFSTRNWSSLGLDWLGLGQFLKKMETMRVHRVHSVRRTVGRLSRRSCGWSDIPTRLDRKLPSSRQLC